MTTIEACVHHWRLSEPNGPFASGTCKRCGAERHDFRNGDMDGFLPGPGGRDMIMSAEQHTRAVTAANAARRRKRAMGGVL